MRVPARGDDPDRLGDAIRDLATGASNAIGTLTLAVSATTSTFYDALCAEGAVIMLSPRTAPAGATSWFIAAVAKGQFTVGHDSSAATNRTFDYEIRRR